MKNWLKIALFFFLITAQINDIQKALAIVKFSNMGVSEIENGMAKLKWNTDQPTMGTVRFGEKPDNLDREMGYGLYDCLHEFFLSGLKKNKTYYYKITAVERSQEKTESFVQSFSTAGMKKEETTEPVFTGKKVLQVINKSAAISWSTNEETTAVVYYRAESEKTARNAGYGKFDREHELFLNGLKPNEKYYIEIAAKDKSGNQASAFLSFNTSDYKEDISDLAVLDIKPLSFEEELVSSRQVMIMWKTNFVAKSAVYYGDSPNNVKKKIDASVSLRLDHQARLTDLEPSKTYFFKIYAYGSFYKKSATAKIMSFTTAPLRKKIANGSLVKGSGYKVYIIKGAEKFWIETAEVFSKLGYKREWIEKVDDAVLNEYKEGKKISSSKIHPDGALVKYANSAAVYLIENGKKRPFSSADAFIRQGYSWDRIIIIPKSEKYKDGEYL